MRIGIIGAGSWGTALAMLLCGNGHHVCVWSWDSLQIQSINKTHHNEAFIHDVRLPLELDFADKLDFLNECEIAVLSVPSHAVAEVCQKIKTYIPQECLLVNTAKGFDGEGRRLSQSINVILPNRLVVLSGPSHAEEVARQMPTAVVAAGESNEANTIVQQVFSNDYFRVYTNDDLCGVEIGGAVKNVIALATGISDGLGFGDNAKAALISRGLAEIVRLGVRLGGRQETFFGLSGVGDLQVTCSSMFSRNRRAGIAIGKGVPVQKVQEDMGMVIEGISAVKHTYILAEEYKIYMPVTAVLYSLLFEGLKPAEALDLLLTHNPAKSEIDFLAKKA